MYRAGFLPAFGQDIGDILEWSEAEFGRAAAARHEALIRQALHDVQATRNGPARRRGLTFRLMPMFIT